MTQIAAAWRPLTRSVRWPTLIGLAATGFAVMLHGRIAAVPAWQYDLRLRLATALIAGGAALVIDDAAARTLEATSRYRTTGLAGRLTAIGSVGAASWLVCVLVVPGAQSASDLGGVAIEATAWLTWSCVAARVAGSSAVMASTFVALFVVHHLPDRWTLTGPTGPGWTPTEMRWAAIAAAGAVALLATLRDPAAGQSRR